MVRESLSTRREIAAQGLGEMVRAAACDCFGSAPWSVWMEGGRQCFTVVTCDTSKADRVLELHRVPGSSHDCIGATQVVPLPPQSPHWGTPPPPSGVHAPSHYSRLPHHEPHSDVQMRGSSCGRRPTIVVVRTESVRREDVGLCFSVAFFLPGAAAKVSPAAR